ncbi:glutamate/aspartate ABC transporter substrate-binding protein [Pandoraea pulmonicola]|uniref:ABC transporter n=1 Tax=Pandoraea pulmonicola TaxID=93221 RepID=A0AAJ4ZCJ5_PANPU|nr:glutamate/aspartate ABC transporter substrate-binding protein [Pandoraea pulmonicola]AJC20709.1 ABC transporter [Pandoraea pulmonicola]SUA90781.1 Glutamate/aspartate periplasmic-binding protein precursor [Pandoraea pulmonicola]
MTRMRLTGVVLGVAMCIAAGTAMAQPASETLQKIESSGAISIGHRESSIPFSYYDNNHNVIGYSQDLCNKIVDSVKTRLKKPDLQVRFIPVTSQNRIALVQNGTVDIECGVTTNLKARQAQVDFSNTFFIAGTRLLVNRTSGIKDFPDLAGKTVVTNAGTTSERILNKMNNDKKMNMNVISGKDYGESFTMLQGGRVQAFMMDDVLLAGARTMGRNPDDWIVTGTPQSFEAYGFMMKHGDTEFKKLVDDTLAGVMKSGEINTMYRKWFESPVPPKHTSFNFPMSDQLKQLYANPNDKAFE